MLCVDKSHLSKYGIEVEDIKGWLIDSAQMTSHFNIISKELGIDPRLQRIDKYAPIYYVNEYTRFSSMLLIYYTEDMPLRAEQNMLFLGSILRFNKDADVVCQVLEGRHCQGSIHKDEDGEYQFVKTSLNWLRDKHIL